MLQLINLSNEVGEVELFNNDPACLRAFLNRYRLDGLEMMFCAPWDKNLHRPPWIQGVHLRFWPCWLDFWRGDRRELLRQFGSEDKIKAYYGGLTREDWLNVYRDNIRTARQAGARYLVFHVSHARTSEVFNWRFQASSREVIAAAGEVINRLAADLPATMTLLLENLWWPGLTLRDRELVGRLLAGIKHSPVGIMLDTGHLMNTNPELTTETAGVEYILATLDRLGDYRRYIRGIHLHRSLAGKYLKRRTAAAAAELTPAGIMNHILQMDEHLPFSTPAVRRIVEYVQPDYLVHEFLPGPLAAWGQKIRRQQRALAGEGDWQ